MDGPSLLERNNVVGWAILGYLCSHPDAKDTAAGVGKWWLRSEGLDADMDRVRGALDHLVERGWLTATLTHSGLSVYGLNKERQLALQRFLQGHPIP
jgi:hypothetical protein